MFHKYLKADIVGEDWSATLSSVRVHIVVRLRWVDFGQQKASLRAALLRVDVARHREPSVEDLLSIVHRRLQQLFEVLVLGHVLVAGRSPLGYGLAVEYEYLEERVHEQYPVGLYAGGVQQHRLGGGR